MQKKMTEIRKVFILNLLTWLQLFYLNAVTVKYTADDEYLLDPHGRNMTYWCRSNYLEKMAIASQKKTAQWNHPLHKHVGEKGPRGARLGPTYPGIRKVWTTPLSQGGDSSGAEWALQPARPPPRWCKWAADPLPCLRAGKGRWQAGRGWEEGWWSQSWKIVGITWVKSLYLWRKKLLE